MNRASEEKIKETAADIVDRSMQALGIEIDMITDITLIQLVLCEMKLNDFTTNYPPMKLFIQNAVSKPQNLKPLLNNIKQGLVEKHPAVIDFLSKALEKGWFEKSEYIQKSVHVAFLLEAITAAMCNSELFFNEILNHIRNKEREHGIDRDHFFLTLWRNFPKSLNFFATAKAVSLDPAMAYFKLRRELGGKPITKGRIKELYKKGELSYVEYKLLLPACGKNTCFCSDWLRINIYEAGITEYNNGFKSNAISAHALSEDAKKHCHREVFKSGSIFPEGEIDEFYQSLNSDDNYFPTFAFHKDWVGLYETWNMAFILGELNNLHFLFPKLLIPSVLNAKPENFLGARIISLWLSINNTLFMNLDNLENIAGPAKRREMAQAWGEINKEYAFRLSSKHIQEDSSVLKKSFQYKFTRPFFKLAKLILRFLF
jgi:hypothetical protein